jgi:hypothetical protein
MKCIIVLLLFISSCNGKKGKINAELVNQASTKIGKLNDSLTHINSNNSITIKIGDSSNSINTIIFDTSKVLHSANENYYRYLSSARDLTSYIKRTIPVHCKNIETEFYDASGRYYRYNYEYDKKIAKHRCESYYTLCNLK